jgi:hypothetical protein
MHLGMPGHPWHVLRDGWHALQVQPYMADIWKRMVSLGQAAQKPNVKTDVSMPVVLRLEAAHI